MSSPLRQRTDLIAKYIEANCGPVELTQADLIECLGMPHHWSRNNGLDRDACAHVIRRKIEESHALALARTLGVAA
ncbi:hypothetical protein FHS96_004975 [Sphingomonas zeicaulis]|uniref:hypothetical protein n=1 Tax=Sphingomonas zeicaulis TaxID=1632740 RepID=UPI003D1EE1B2